MQIIHNLINKHQPIFLYNNFCFLNRIFKDLKNIPISCFFKIDFSFKINMEYKFPKKEINKIYANNIIIQNKDIIPRN